MRKSPLKGMVANAVKVGEQSPQVYIEELSFNELLDQEDLRLSKTLQQAANT